MGRGGAWWVCCLLTVCMPLQAATRVALIGSRDQKAAGHCLALAEAELSGGSEIALVERQQIGRLLAEGELSLGGMVDAATAIRVGKLLGADVLAVVETDPQSAQALGILAFETTSGMHLCDRALAENDPALAGRQIAEAVRLAVRKRALGPGARRTFCLVSVRNADLPLSANPLCDCVGRLVERALTNSPDIVVLERKRFELIKQEAALRQLGGETAEMKLLSAVLTAEIEVRRGRGEEILAAATITTADGQRLGTVRAKADFQDPLRLAEGLGPQMAALMKAAPATAITNRRQEAGRFAREALFCHQHHQLPQALSSLEAALAIDASGIPVLEAAAEICFSAAGETLEPGRFLLPPRKIRVGRETLDASLALAERAMKMTETAAQRQAEEHRPVLAELLNAVANPDGSFRIQEPLLGMFYAELYLERLPLIESADAKEGLRFAGLARRYRQVCRALDARARREVHDQSSYIRYTNWLSVLSRNVELFSPKAKDWADQSADLLESWLPLADRYGVYENEFFTLNTMIARMASQSAQLDRVGYAGRWVVTSADAERLRAAFGKMASHRQKALAVLGQTALFTSETTWRQPSEDEVTDRFQKLCGRVKEIVADPGPADRRPTRTICCYALLDAVESLPTAAARRRQFQLLLDWMLARGELVYGAALAAVEPTHTGHDYYAPYLYRTFRRRSGCVAAPGDYDALAATARRVLEQIGKHAVVCLDGQESRLRYRLTDACQTMYLLRPGLRPKAPAPWARAVRLLSVTDYPELRAISRVQVRGHTVWTMGLGDWKSQVDKHGVFRGGWDKLFGGTATGAPPAEERPFRYGILEPIAIDLQSGDRRILRKLGYPRDSFGGAALTYVDNCPFDLDDQTLCVGSFAQGLCFLPLDGKPAEWLDYEGQVPAGQRGPSGEKNMIRHCKDVPDDERLPSRRLLSLAVQDGKVFASVGPFSRQGSFLVSVRLDDHKVRIIASSRGGRQQNPLDGLDEPPLVFLPMVKDPQRHRVLFVVSHPLSHGGLWAFDTRTETIRRLTAYEHYVQWISGNRGGRVVLALANADCSQWYAVEYDLARDRQELLYSSTAAAAVDGLQPGTRTIVAPGWLAQPPYLPRGDCLWTLWPFGRIERGQVGGVAFPPLEDQADLLRGLAGLDREFNWRTAEPLDDGRVLLSNRFGIWLITP